MSPQEAKQKYREGDPAFQARILASFAYLLTIAARESYEVGGEGLVDPPRLRKSNEVMHRITAQICALLVGDSRRFPDDVILKIMNGAAGGAGGSLLATVVARAVPE